ncbi:MAG: ABC transporter substrate-binding protein [Pseudomonadota bacterium]
MRSNDLKATRRGLLLTGLAALAWPRAALALTTAEATQLIERVMSDTMTIVNSNASTAQALTRFEQVFEKHADVPVIARSVLGQPWRGASPAQQRAFSTAFRGYLARKYGREFREFRGSRVEITRAVDQGNRGIVVSTVLTIPGSPPISVDWQVTDRSGQPKMFNLFIEGISMLSTERSEVRAILEGHRNDLNALIADLNRRG